MRQTSTMVDVGIEWVEIVEPRTKEHMYANLTTGECAWEPPLGVRVYVRIGNSDENVRFRFRKRTNDNQWWELFDSNSGRFYYYNATTMKTVWQRPAKCDIIPLAKLQTLKQNTEAPSTANSGACSSYYDEPRSPSTPSRSSSRACENRSFASSDSSQPTTSCHTQTTPAASPKVSRMHKSNCANHLPTKQTISCQTVQSSRQCNKGHLQRRHSKHRHRSIETNTEEIDESRGKSSNVSQGDGTNIDRLAQPLRVDEGWEFQEAILRLETDEMAADLERYMATLERCNSNAGRHTEPPQQISHRQSSFVRNLLPSSLTSHQKNSNFDPCGSPLLGATRRSLNPLNDRSTATLGKPQKMDGREKGKDALFGKQFSKDSAFHGRDLSKQSPKEPAFPPPPMNSTTFRGAFAQNLSADAKIVASKNDDKSDDPSCTSTTTTEVWTPRHDMSMIKSLDSGIKSSESTVERNLPDSSASPLIVRKRPPTKSLQRHRTPPPNGRESFSFLIPCQQLAANLSFSAEHEQFVILGRNRDEIDPIHSGADDPSSDEEGVLGMDEDEVFADDEVDLGEQSPHSLSSLEELTATSVPADVYYTSSDPFRPVVQLQSQIRTPHAQHPALGTRSPALRISASSSNTSSVGRRPPPHPPIPPSSFVEANRNTNGDMTIKCMGRGSSLERQHAAPDQSPSLHRPQSMMVGPAPSEPPMNTATTLTRPPTTTTSTAASDSATLSNVVVSRSAGSLARGVQGTTNLELYREGDLDQFAQEKINRHKKGLFGKRRSVQTMLTWSREAVKMPLIMTNDKRVKKEAVNLFKRVQAYMGDRKVKEKAGVSLEQLALDLCVRGWAKPALRDEIIMQVVKQITGNPRPEGIRRGWELLAVCLAFFPPSEVLHTFLESFIQRNCDPLLDIPEVSVSHYAQHCTTKLERISVALNV